jgi:hypothetical protein
MGSHKYSAEQLQNLRGRQVPQALVTAARKDSDIGMLVGPKEANGMYLSDADGPRDTNQVK